MPREPLRRKRADELLARLERGPSLRTNQVSSQDATEQVRRWLETWIIPDVLALVPELKGVAVPHPRPESWPESWPEPHFGDSSDLD